MNNQNQNTQTNSKKARKAKHITPITTADVQPEQPKAKPKSLAATMAKYRGSYVDGRSCGDTTASRLAGMSLEAIIAEAEQVSGLEPGALVTKYAHLNKGQRRMTAGNRIRAAAKRAVIAEIAALIPKS